MKNIQIDIKNIVHENLINTRKNLLIESYNGIDFVSKEDFIKKHIEKSIQLIHEGYDINEIAGVLDDVTKKAKDITGDFDFGKTFSDSLISMAKEFGIKWILDYFGFNPTLSTYLAQGLADVDIKDFFLTFKNETTCKQHAPILLDAVLEVLVRYAGGKLTGAITGANKEDKMQDIWAKDYKKKMKDYENNMKSYKRTGQWINPATGEPVNQPPIKPKEFKPKYSKNSYNWGDLPSILSGNIAGDLIRQTSTSETLAAPLCKLIHEVKNQI